MADLTLKIRSQNEASEVLKGVGEDIKRLGANVLDFAKTSLNAFMEAERGTKQLALVAGELTETFKAQASAFQQSLGVSDDMVMKVQTLALTMGAAPAQVEGLTAAILDYSARTGTDAVNATDMLVKGVVAGTGHIKALGIAYEATGDFTKDLASATAALASKYAGAAKEDASTLAGSVRMAEEAMGEMKESFGGMIAKFVQETGVVKDLTWSIQQLHKALFPDKPDQRSAIVQELQNIEQARFKFSGMSNEEKTKIWGVSGDTYLEMLEREKMLKRQLQLIDQERAETAERHSKALGVPGKGQVHKQPKAAKAVGLGESYSSMAEELRLFGSDGSETPSTPGLGENFSSMSEEMRLFGIGEADMKEAEKAAERLAKAQLDALKKSQAEQKKELDAQERMYATAGNNIAAGFVGAFAAQMAELGDGGQFDIGSFFAQLFGVIAGIVGSFFGPVGTAVGGVVAGGMNALAAAGRRGGRRGSTAQSAYRHEGGWGDPGEVPRFHDGGWPGLGMDEVPAILKRRERVLSETEVSRMGGPGAVDQAAAGRGPAVSLQVTTLDSSSFREFLEDKGGRGFANAVRSGRGDVARLISGRRR